MDETDENDQGMRHKEENPRAEGFGPKPSAHFVSYPARIEDLRRPYLHTEQNMYIIEKTVLLKKIDYENFITDLCVTRWFLEENAYLCSLDEDRVMHCLFVRRKGKNDGILVVSDANGYAAWAAYLPDLID